MLKYKHIYNYKENLKHIQNFTKIVGCNSIWFDQSYINNTLLYISTKRVQSRHYYLRKIPKKKTQMHFFIKHCIHIHIICLLSN